MVDSKGVCRVTAYGGTTELTAAKVNNGQNDLYQVKVTTTDVHGSGAAMQGNLACNIAPDAGLSCQLDADPTIDIFKIYNSLLLIQDSKGNYGSAATLNLKVYTQP